MVTCCTRCNMCISVTGTCRQRLPGRAEMLPASCGTSASPLLQVHRNSREWKNTPKGHHSPVQIADYPLHPSWKDFIKAMSVLKQPRKYETVLRV